MLRKISTRESAMRRYFEPFFAARFWMFWASLVALTAGSACDSSNEAKPSCAPQCGEGCGEADGCGGTCGCEDGTQCVRGACEPAVCAIDCGPREQCVRGECECKPICDERACEDDGCGGTCPCPDGLVLNADGELVPKAECHDTCAGAGHACGAVCGEPCGQCADGKLCEAGRCGCVPACDGTSCNDGCGGTCECAAGNVCDPSGRCVAPSQCTQTCASTGAECGTVCGAACGACPSDKTCVAAHCSVGASCSDCALTLSLVRSEITGDRRKVVLAVDYEAREQEPQPRMADVRIRVSTDVRLTTAEEGLALTNVGKALYRDSATNLPYKRRANGTYQIVAYGLSSGVPIENGRIATLTFDAPADGDLAFALERRLQTLAPAAADMALQATDYDQPVVVSP